MGKKTKAKTSSSRCCVYDFTMHYPEGYVPNPDTDQYLTGICAIRRTLDETCKKYCFQLEKGEDTGRYHLQGRFSLKKKGYLEATAKLFREKGWCKFKLSHTSNENMTNMFYVMKDETRIDGPFTESNYVKIPREVAKMKVLRPWQDKLFSILFEYDERGINCVIDPKGNRGKSMFVKYMCVLHKAGMMPFCKEYRDVMRIAYDIGERSMYLIDFPRSVTANCMTEMMKAIEVLKNGYCYDDRNHFRERFMDNVNICVFANCEPNLSGVTADRWRLWEIDDNMRLRRYRNPLDYVDVSCSSDEDPNSSSSSRESDSCELSDTLLNESDFDISSSDQTTEEEEIIKKSSRADKDRPISDKKRTAKK